MGADAVDKAGTAMPGARGTLTITLKVGEGAPLRTAATTLSFPEASKQLWGDW